MFPIRPYRFLVPFVREEWRSYVLGVVLTLLTCGFWVSIPKLVGLAIHCLDAGARVDLVPALSLAIVGVVLLRGLTSFWMRRIVIGASRRIEFRIRNLLFRHIETLDSSFFVTRHTGDLINRFTSDVEAVRAVIGPGIMYTLNTAFTLLMALYLMLAMNVSLTVYSLLPLILLTVVVRWLGPRVHRESMHAQERLSDISIHAQENFSNARVVKAFVREEAEIERMQKLADEYFEQNMVLGRLRAWIGGVLFLVGDLALIFLLGLGGPQLIDGRLGLGEFAAFKGVQLILIWPMIALGWVINIFQRGAASAQRLREILEVRPRVDDSAADPRARITAGAVEFDRVSFGYTPDTKVLDALTLEVGGGQTLGIVGPTGSGKTTLLHLIPRLHALDRGEIRIDGIPQDRFTLEHLRERIAYVPQEAFLFSATVEENLRFGSPEVATETLIDVAHLVSLHDEISAFSQGYQERVGERGITVSGGQRQRIALARALLRDPTILLLDDVLSAVDARTEKEILRGLRRWTRELTTIIVSHRLSALRHANHIIVLESGRVIEAGTHDELVLQSGYYASQYRKQTLEDELESL